MSGVAGYSRQKPKAATMKVFIVSGQTPKGEQQPNI